MKPFSLAEPNSRNEQYDVIGIQLPSNNNDLLLIGIILMSVLFFELLKRILNVSSDPTT